MESRNTYGYMDEDRMNIPSSSGLVRPKEALTQASVAGEEELAELLVTRSQNERSLTKTAIDEDEDEVATWLHSLPLDYCSDLYSDIVYPQQPYAAVLATSSKVVSDAPIAEFNNPMQPSGERPPIPSSWRQKLEVSRHRGRIWKEAGTSGLNEPVKEFNVFESSKTHAAAVATKYRAPSGGIRRRVRTSTVVATSLAAADIIEANDLTGSGPNVSAADSDPVLLRPSMMAMDLKRKGRQIEDSDNSEVIAALESLDLQNKASSKSSSSSSKKSRCAEVHSLSEKVCSSFNFKL
ncbi:transcription factor PIF1-like [Impatiens glandulifera]|uniref:transcription factor PIF1-like n=1 Tax=Impatiens glandulifera TaxID=253017 RepID=UPI001FB0A9BE|nr:transcription factor PIF1-like [Impatiens glandulifera]